MALCLHSRFAPSLAHFVSIYNFKVASLHREEACCIKTRDRMGLFSQCFLGDPPPCRSDGLLRAVFFSVSALTERCVEEAIIAGTAPLFSIFIGGVHHGGYFNTGEHGQNRSKSLCCKYYSKCCSVCGEGNGGCSCSFSGNGQRRSTFGFGCFQQYHRYNWGKALSKKLRPSAPLRT